MDNFACRTESFFPRHYTNFDCYFLIFCDDFADFRADFVDCECDDLVNCEDDFADCESNLQLKTLANTKQTLWANNFP